LFEKTLINDGTEILEKTDTHRVAITRELHVMLAADTTKDWDLVLLTVTRMN